MRHTCLLVLIRGPCQPFAVQTKLYCFSFDVSPAGESKPLFSTPHTSRYFLQVLALELCWASQPTHWVPRKECWRPGGMAALCAAVLWLRVSREFVTSTYTPCFLPQLKTAIILMRWKMVRENDHVLQNTKDFFLWGIFLWLFHYLHSFLPKRVSVWVVWHPDSCLVVGDCQTPSDVSFLLWDKMEQSLWPLP